MKILAEHLVATGCRIDAVYCGPLERQKSSADEVIRRCRKLDWHMPAPVVRSDLSEYDYQAVLASQLPDMIAVDPSVEKDLENIYTDEAAFENVFARAVRRWVSGNFDKPGVETWRDFSRRVNQALAEITADQGGGGSIMVFTSGGVITAALQASLELNERQALKLSWLLANASITRFSCRGKQLTLTGFNAIAHLELRRDRTLITYR